MFHTMLLCFDGTRESHAALRRGAELAAACRAQVHLLAVIQTSAMALVGEALSPEAPLADYQQRVKDILQEGVESLRALGVTAKGHIAIGDPVTEIAAAARTLSVDLIVLGHHSQSAFARWWRGSLDVSLLDVVHSSILVCIEPPGAQPIA
ncbi:MAG: universal stress protein [Gammaproteobacteria bacterium]|nr:universal stress protein [Gammaproteobacteria bacterium]